MLPKRKRLTTEDFEKTFKKGARYNTPSLLCIYAPAKSAALSVAVTKKQYPLAVDRNKIRRVIYGCIAGLPKNTHIIILVRKKVAKKEENTLCAEVSGFIHSLSV